MVDGLQRLIPRFLFFPLMKYNILINQKAVIDAGFDLDIVDLAIFELLKDFSLTDQCKKMSANDIVYFLFNWKLINTQLPILGLNSRQAVFKRLEKLRCCDIIQPHNDNATLGKSWYCFSHNYERMVFQKVTTLVDAPVNESLQLPDNNGLHNNNPIHNIIKDKEQPAQIRYKKTIAFLKLIIDWIANNPDKYPKLMFVEFAKYWVEPHKTSAIKIRFDKEEYFDIGKRLTTWFKGVKQEELNTYWEQEPKLGTVNDLFKKQILKINGTSTGN